VLEHSRATDPVSFLGDALEYATSEELASYLLVVEKFQLLCGDDRREALRALSSAFQARCRGAFTNHERAATLLGVVIENYDSPLAMLFSCYEHVKHWRDRGRRIAAELVPYAFCWLSDGRLRQRVIDVFGTAPVSDASD
jgi:hypothetical protein